MADGRDPHRWSQRVSQTSHALDLEPGVFTWDDPRRIASSLYQSADRSRLKQRSSFGSAMAMLCFYLNRAGRKLPHHRRMVLELAKHELRALHQEQQKGADWQPQGKSDQSHARSDKQV